MNAIPFLAGAVTLMSLSIFIITKTSPHAYVSGGPAYEKARAVRVFGHILLVAGFLLLGISALYLFNLSV